MSHTECFLLLSSLCYRAPSGELRRVEEKDIFLILYFSVYFWFVIKYGVILFTLESCEVEIEQYKILTETL